MWTNRRFLRELIISTGSTLTLPIVITDEEQFLGNDFGYMNAGPGETPFSATMSEAMPTTTGIQKPGEIGLGGVTMQLVTSPGGSLVATTATNAFGIKFFTNVTPGAYVVKIRYSGNPRLHTLRGTSEHRETRQRSLSRGRWQQLYHDGLWLLQLLSSTASAIACGSIWTMTPQPAGRAG